MGGAWAPAQFHNTDGRAAIVLVCEHAARLIPGDFDDLGLAEAALHSHAAWDIGALDVARGLSEALDAPLVSAGVSRLLYDCNRPPSAPDCIPEKSEVFAIPGNRDLSDVQRDTRRRLIHDPFHNAVDGLIGSQIAKTGRPVIVITAHSFTPVFHGRRRAVEIGFLHHANARLSEAAQRLEARRGRYRVELNAPYSAADGVTYSLRRHADARQLHSTMIEIRNDLIDSKETAQAVAAHLAVTLRDAIDLVTQKTCALEKT